MLSTGVPVLATYATSPVTGGETRNGRGSSPADDRHLSHTGKGQVIAQELPRPSLLITPRHRTRTGLRRTTAERMSPSATIETVGGFPRRRAGDMVHEQAISSANVQPPPQLSTSHLATRPITDHPNVSRRPSLSGRNLAPCPGSGLIRRASPHPESPAPDGDGEPGVQDRALRHQQPGVPPAATATGGTTGKLVCRARALIPSRSSSQMHDSRSRMALAAATGSRSKRPVATANQRRPIRQISTVVRVLP